MAVAVLTIHLQLPDCSSLKDKRSRIKPILARLRKEFNVSAAEVDLQDRWREAVIACAMIGNDRVFLNNALQAVLEFVNRRWPDLPIVAENIEIW
jgi:uncharacterized protein YlxP (DUF503 family)